MIDFTAISKGFNERQDYNRNKRLEVMELFEEFKRNNPEATMADFQSFRDQVSGGRNYLRGGVGNDAALKRIVDTNERKRQQAAAARSQSEAMQKLQFMRELQPFIDNELVNMQEIKGGPGNQYSSYDTAGAIKNVKDMFGGSLPFDMDITNMMSEGNRSRAVQSMVFKKLPQAREYIGDLTDPSQANAGELATLLQVPQTVAQQLLDSATKEYEATQGEKLRGLGRIITGDIERLAAKPNMTWSEVTSILDKQYSDDPLYKKWKDTSLDGSKGVFDNTNEEINKTKDQENIVTLNAAVDKLKPALLAGIQSDGVAEATKKFKEDLKRNVVESLHGLITDDYVANEVEGLRNQAAQVQQDNFATANSLQKVENRQLKAKLIEQQENLVTETLGTPDGRFNNDNELLVAAKQMAQLFKMDNNAITIIGSLAENIPSDATFEDKVAIFRKGLEDKGQIKFEEILERQQELSSARSGILEPQTFTQYFGKRADDYDEITNAINNFVEKIRQSGETPEKKIAKLRGYLVRAKDEFKHFTDVIEADRIASIGTISDQSKNYIWLDPETPWDQSLIDQFMKGASGEIDYINEQISAQQKAIKERDANRVELGNTVGDQESFGDPESVTNDGKINNVVKKTAASILQGNMPTAVELIKIMVDDLNIKRPKSRKEYVEDFRQDLTDFVKLIAQEGATLSSAVIEQIAIEMQPEGYEQMLRPLPITE